MTSSESAVGQAKKPWLLYYLVVSFGIAVFAASITFAGTVPPGASRWIPLIVMLLSGLVFSALGFFSAKKDTHKGFGVALLAVGSLVVGLAPFIVR